MYSSIWLCAINPTDQSLFCQARKFCPQGTNQNDLLNLERVHMIFHSSTWEQLSVEYTSTCSQVEFKSTNASQALEYRCRSSTGVQMPCQVHEYRCQSNTGVQTPAEYMSTDAMSTELWAQMCPRRFTPSGNPPSHCQNPMLIGEESLSTKLCTQKYCANVKIQCSLERNH